MPDNETVAGEELAGRAEAAFVFLYRGLGRSASAEEFPRRVSFKGILPVCRACMTGLPADLPVLFRILHTGRVRFHGNEEIVRWGIIGFLWIVLKNDGQYRHHDYFA
jgi:hypothetical protein